MVAEWDHREKKKKKKMLTLVISKSRIVVQDQLFLGYQDFFGNLELHQPQVQEDLGR